jgi:hypothetical protein
MIMQSLAAAIGEAAIRVKYDGPYAYAALVLVPGTTAPALSLGVSDTSQADAVSNAEAVITGDGTLTLQDVVAAIEMWNTTTASHVVQEREFECDIFNAIYTDVFGGSSAAYVAAAGVLNLKNTFVGCLIIVNGNTGTITIRVPPPALSKNTITIKDISGHAGTSGTPTVTRQILGNDGTVYYSSGAIANATDALMKPSVVAPLFFEPLQFAGGVVVVRDTCATPAHANATTVNVMWGLPKAKDL